MGDLNMMKLTDQEERGILTIENVLKSNQKNTVDRNGGSSSAVFFV